MKRAAAFWILLAMLVAACAPAGGTRAPSADTPPTDRQAGPKRILTAVVSELPTARSQLNRASGGTLPGARELEQLIHAGLAVEDSSGNLRPQLAEAAPTVENGLWRVFPDGRMETTWKIRPNAMWHDRTPFTAEDLVFTARIAQDKDLGLFGQLAYESIASVEATDPRTITVRWSRPFIEADTMFSGVGNFQAVPLPRHLLEPQYVENKAAFLNLPYWSNEYVGAGPFKIRDWVQGSHVSLEAFDGYVLGRPKVDEIEVKFIPDPTTLVANILAGAVELPIGRGLSLDQTLEVRERWQEGTVVFGPGGAIKVWPQLRYAQLPRIADVQFRRALYHGMDRQQMADTLMGGLSEVAHSVLIPTDREFAALDPAVVRYDYDPRRAMALLEELGLTRGADGVFREPNGQRLSVEVRATVIDILQKTVLAMSSDWQRIGIAVEPHTITAARQNDREYRSTFPAFDTSRGNNSVETFKTFLGSEARVPDNRYAGANYPNYQNADLDALINRFLVTIPMEERLDAGRQVVRHLSEQVVVMPTFYDVLGTMTGKRLVNVPTKPAQNYTTTWGAHEWDVH